MLIRTIPESQAMITKLSERLVERGCGPICRRRSDSRRRIGIKATVMSAQSRAMKPAAGIVQYSVAMGLEFRIGAAYGAEGEYLNKPFYRIQRRLEIEEKIFVLS